MNSVKDLQKMSAAREGTPPGKRGEDDYDGLFAKPKPAVKEGKWSFCLTFCFDFTNTFLLFSLHGVL